ncbi:MAG: pyridoxine 5'-phosphate synthase [Muribaculaceae bacterium]|nr:pyridoxine 5'-phosphate synthase [Muribaculaceae bacterium]
MVKLSVNINKIATLRNARGGDNPNVEQFAEDCEHFGADGITVHPRPDERHIRRDDVIALKNYVRTELNIEGYPSPQFMELVLMVKPTQVTLVPDAPDALTSSAGWEVEPNLEMLTEVVDRLKEAGIRTSIFVGTNEDNIRMAARTGTDRVELYTEPYAREYKEDPAAAVAPFAQAAEVAHKVGLGVNAGHDLSLDNLKYFKENVPHLLEVSIGHALISDCIYMGIEQTIKAYRDCLK